MPSIIRLRDTFHGISIAGRGVFTDNLNGSVTYAGQYKDGHACGLGVATYSDGTKVYAEHGPDGKYDGRCFGRWTNGNTGYYLFERGKRKEFTDVDADGTCVFNCVDCAPDDPRLLALIALVAPVEVRPAAPAPYPPLAPKQSSDGSAGSFCSRRRWRPPWPPRCTRIPHAVAGGRATQPQQQPHCKARPHSDACARPFCGTGLMGGTLVCTPMGSSRQLRCYAIVQHTAVRNAGIWGGLYVSVQHCRTPQSFFSLEPALPGFAVSDIQFDLAGRGGRGQPAAALGGARALRPTKCCGVL